MAANSRKKGAKDSKHSLQEALDECHDLLQKMKKPKRNCTSIFSGILWRGDVKVTTHTSHVFKMSMFHAPAQMMVKNVVIYLINPFVFVKLELYKPFFNVFYSKILKLTLWRVMTNATIIILPKRDIDQSLLGEVDDVGHEMPSTSSVEGKFCTSQSCFLIQTPTEFVWHFINHIKQSLS